MDVRAFGSWMSAPKCLFSWIFEGPDRSFLPPDVHQDIRVDVRPKTYSFGSFSVPEKFWEADFYTPQVLGGAASFDNSAPAVYENQGP